MARPYVLLDIDGTLFAGDKINTDLLRSLQNREITHVSLVTSYGLQWNAEKSCRDNTQRIRAIRLLKRYGITVDHTFVSASPYAESTRIAETLGAAPSLEENSQPPKNLQVFQKTIGIQREPLKPGDYFKTVIQPIEEALADAPEEERKAILDKQNMQAESSTIGYFQGKEQEELQGAADSIRVKGGKENLLQHAREALLTEGVIKSDDPLLLFDDKLEVIRNVEHAPWAKADNQPSLSVCAVREFFFGIPEFQTYEKALNTHDSHNSLGDMKAYYTQSIGSIFYIQLSTFKEWPLSEQMNFIKQLEWDDRIIWLNDTGASCDIKKNPGLAIDPEQNKNNPQEDGGPSNQNDLAWCIKQIKLTTMGTYDYNPTVTKRLLKEQWAEELGTLEAAVMGLSKHCTVLLGEDDLKAAKALEEDYSTDPTITVLTIPAQAGVASTVANAHARDLLLHQIQYLCNGLSVEDNLEANKILVAQLQPISDILSTTTLLTNQYDLLKGCIEHFFEDRRQQDESTVATFLNDFSNLFLQQLIADPKQLDHPHITEDQLAKLIEHFSALLCKKESKFALVENEVLKPLWETYQALHSESADNAGNPLPQAANKRLEDRQRLVKGTLLKTLNELTKTLAKEDPPSFNEACTNASKVLETASKHKLSKRSGLKAFFIGLAGFLAALPTFLLAYKNKNFRSTFWHQEKEEGAFWGGTFRTCQGSLQKAANPSTPIKKP